MEALLFFALVIIIVLLVKIKSFQKETAVRTQERFLSIQKELVELNERVKKPSPEILPVNPTDENVVQWRPYVAPEITISPVETPPAVLLPEVANETINDADPAAIEEDPIVSSATPLPTYVSAAVAESWWEKWLRNNPGLEKFIGEKPHQ